MLGGLRVGALVSVGSAVALGSLWIGCAGDNGGVGGSASTGATNGATASHAAATNSAASQAAATSGTGSTGAGAFACAGMPLPTTAPNQITVGGKSVTVGLSGQQPLGNVSLEVYVGTSVTPVATTTSDAMGVYSVALATGGYPLDGYIHGTEATYLESYLYPNAPLAADTDKGTMLLITANTFSLLQSFAVVTQTPGNAWLGVVVSDCNNNPVAGATVTTVPAGTVKYNMGGIPSSAPMSTDVDGVAYVFNLPPGDVTVKATAGATTLREHVLNARADVITTTAITP